MNNKEHKLGISEANLVVRHIRIDCKTAASIEAAIKAISNIYGVDDITFDDKSNTLNIAYDASRLGIDNIEEVLKNQKIEISHDWITKFKESYYRFVDQNVKENANHIPACCSKPPSIK